jgi:hypothetical protein
LPPGRHRIVDPVSVKGEVSIADLHPVRPLGAWVPSSSDSSRHVFKFNRFQRHGQFPFLCSPIQTGLTWWI